MKPIFTFLLLLFLASNSFGQFTEAQRFARVPEQHRAKLKEKLAVFIGYYRTDNWGGVYDSLCKTKQTKTEFIGNFTRYNFWGLDKLVEFNPMVRGTYVDTPEFADSGYLLTGCVRFEKGKSYTHSLSAYLTKGDWCFDAIYPTDLFEGTKQRPCKMSDYDAPALPLSR